MYPNFQACDRTSVSLQAYYLSECGS